MAARKNVVDAFGGSVLSERQLLIERMEIEQERTRQHEKHLAELNLEISKHQEMIQRADDEIQRVRAAVNTGEQYLRSLKKSAFSLQQHERSLQEKLTLQEQKSAAKHKELSKIETKYKSLLATIAKVERDIKASEGILQLEEKVKALQEKNAAKEAYLRSLKEDISRQKEEKCRSATQPYVELARIYIDSEATKRNVESLNNRIQELTLAKELKMRELEKSQEKTAAGKKPSKLLPIIEAPSEELAPSPTVQSTSIYFSKQSRALASAVPSTTLQVQDPTAAAPTATPRSPQFAKPASSTSAAFDKEPIKRALELLKSPRRPTTPSASSTYLDDLRTMMSTPRPSLTKRPLEPNTRNSDVLPAKQSRNEREWPPPKPAAIDGPRPRVEISSLPCDGDVPAATSASDQYQDMQTAESSGLSYEYAKEENVQRGFPKPDIQGKAFSMPPSSDCNQTELSLPSPKMQPAEAELHPESGSIKLSDSDSDLSKFDALVSENADEPYEPYDVFGDDNSSVPEETSGFKLAPANFGQGQRKFFF